MKMRLCYRVDKKAGWGEDENGNATEVYSCIKIDCNTYTIPNEEYKELVNIGKKLTATSFNIEEELITPITLNEYLDNTEEED